MSAAILHMPLEKLIVKATGFKLSPMQLAIIAIGTGKRVQDLRGEVRECAEHGLGYGEGPVKAPRILFLNCGARGSKTMCAAYLATHRALVCDLSGMAPGEQARVAFVSASMRQARAGLTYARGFIVALGLGKIIHSDRRDAFTIRRDGHDVEFAVVRGNTGGDALAGFWYPALVVHEAAIATDPSSHGVALDLDAVEKAVRPRLLPARGKSLGGLIIEETTSRDATGPAYERVIGNHGKADAPIVVFKATTLELRPDDDALREHVEAEHEADPINAQREFDCEWISDGASGGFVFGEELLNPCTVDRPTTMRPEPHLEAWAGIDLAFTSDGSALAIVRKRPTGDLELCSLKRWRPTKGQPLKPSVVIGEAFDEMQRHGCRLVWSDTHHYAQLLEHAQQRRGINPKQAPAGSAGKHTAHANAQEVLASGRFRMGRDHKLLKALKAIVATRSPNGAITIRSPRRSGDHGDDASAVVLALHGTHLRAGRGADPLPAGGTPSAMLHRLGITDRNGNQANGIDFKVDSAGRARAVPGTSRGPFESPDRSQWHRQGAF